MLADQFLEAGARKRIPSSRFASTRPARVAKLVTAGFSEVSGRAPYAPQTRVG